MRGLKQSVVILLLLAAGCGRVIKRYPAGVHSMTPTAAAKIELPPGARCRPDPALTALSDEQGDTRCRDASGSGAWPEWSDAQPAGLCYTLDGPCDGVDDHVAYLTFDDGPSDWTAEILAILAAQDVRATFFVNARGLKGPQGLDGSYKDKTGKVVFYRELLKRELDAGHVLGNHTLDHIDLGAQTEDEIFRQLQENERLVNVALHQIGAPTEPLTIVRPPFGSPWFHGNIELSDPDASRELTGSVFARYGYNVLWNISSTDANEWAIGESYNQLQLDKMRWESDVPYDTKVARIRDTVLEHALVRDGKGIVVLMHDSHNATRDALSDLIDGLRARGYRFSTIEDQVQQQYGRPSLELLPGPALRRACGVERERSCAELPSGEVCGRYWEAYAAFGGEDALGKPLSSPARQDSGALGQSFEHGTIELHPEEPAPCDVVLLP